MDIKVGETFNFNGIELRVENSKVGNHNPCFGCYFSMPRCHKPIDLGSCVMDNKMDNEEGHNIIFKKVNPYE